jgi:hypothetical protein
MSEKYSTEELVGFLGNGKLFIEIETRPDDAGKPFQKVYVGLGEGIQDAIIARLRAGGNLLDMMRLMELRTDENGETWFSIFNEGGRSALINITSHGPIVRGAFADFEARRKNAIADYEGKEE